MKKLLLALFAVLLLSSQAYGAAAHYWVSKSGSDGNGCTDSASPLTTTAKLTIAAGIACMTPANADILSIRTGTYAEDLISASITFPAGTNFTNAATIRAHTAEAVHIRRIQVGLGKRYLIFQDLIVDGAASPGPESIGIGGGEALGTGAGFVRFVNVDVHGSPTDPGNPACVAFAAGSIGGNEFIGGKVHDCDYPSPTLRPTAHGFYVSSPNNLVDGVEIYNVGQFAIHNYSDNPSNNIYRNNFIHDTGTASNPSITSYLSFAIGIYTGNGNRVYNNTVVRSTTGADIASSNNLIYNNSFYNNTDPNPTCCYSAIKNNSGSGNVIKNNILVANSINSIDTSGSSGTVSSNDITTGTAASHFVNAAADNLSLISTSAAINAGTASIASGVTACANGSAPDVGAIESLGQPTATVNGTAAIITVVNNCTSQLLPATGVTGFTFKKNGSGDTVTANIRSGGNSYAATLTSAFVAGDTCLFSYSQTGNATSDNNIGGVTTSNQEIFAFTDVACTNISGGGGGAVALSDWKIFLLQGATDTVWVQKCALNSTNCTVAPGSKLWIVSNLRNNSGSTFPTFNLSNRWRYNGGSYVALTASYVNAIKVLGTGQQLGTVVNDGTVMTADLIANRESTNVSCIAIRSTSQVPAVALVDASEANCGQAIDIATTATPGDTYEDCPFTDTGTALTCATPIKITVGSYASAR